MALALGLSLSTHPSKPLFYIHATLERPLSYLLYGAFHIQFSFIFILNTSFSCVGKFFSGFGLWGRGGSMNSQKHLVHLRDGISMATSPLLRNNGKAYTVAERLDTVKT